MSRTMTILNGSVGLRNRSAKASRRFLLRMWVCHVDRIGWRTRHHDLECAVFVVGVIPGRPQRYDLPIEVHADPAAHAYDHRLAVHCGESVLEVFDQVAGDQLDPMLRSHHRFQLRPP